jgi:hypothetical protein
MSMSKRLLWSAVSACLVAGFTAQSAVAADPGSKSLEARVQAIEDRLAIEDLIGGEYAMALDTGNAAAYAGVFTEDAFLSVAGREYRGHKEIEAMAKELESGHTKYDSRKAAPGQHLWGPVRHVVTNPVIHITGNTATSNSYSTEIGSNGRDEKQHGNPQSIMNVCRYEDNLVKTNGKWLISKRLITCDMFGKRSHAPDMYPQTVTPSDVSP